MTVAHRRLMGERLALNRDISAGLDAGDQDRADIAAPPVELTELKCQERRLLATRYVSGASKAAKTLSMALARC